MVLLDPELVPWDGGELLKWNVPVCGSFIGRFKCGKMVSPSKEEFLYK